MPIATVLHAQHKKLKDQINRIDDDYEAQCNKRAKRHQQQKIAKRPALANKEILSGKTVSPPHAQALTDPSTGEVETEPRK
eukprot:174251-Pelagomonas_calceolata.AAC.1